MRRIVVALLTVMLLGCAEKLTAEEIVERVESKYEEIDDYKGCSNNPYRG